jgi:hypothetical protein
MPQKIRAMIEPMDINHSFESFDFKNGMLKDLSRSAHPCRVYGIVGEQDFICDHRSSYFLFVYKGMVAVDYVYPITNNMYAMVRGKGLYSRPGTRALLIESIGYDSPFVLGGPLESQGRLKYIDGCTDSLLIPPVKLGDPCLNHLHFPGGIDQTMHTHPSVRIGLVSQGRGQCVTPWGNVDLLPGMVFVIHPEDGRKEKGLDGNEHPVGSHCFRTFNSTMDVVAFHPDSDFGPTDEVHPMVNRTIVNGVSASLIPEIRTK